ncbi:MAG: hypothetical protein JWN44_7111 [Myxococcales bacterium]|nr:hypothetical protein [Myxococcales bacterium]
MMRGLITECDFEECECAFPGIMRYYRELKVKPDTFLELLWSFIHQDCACSEPVPVASRPAIPATIR